MNRCVTDAALTMMVVMACSYASLTYAQITIPKEKILPDTPGNVRDKIDLLYSPDARTRAEAAHDLEFMNWPPAEPFLVDLLCDQTSLEWRFKDPSRGSLHLSSSPGEEAAGALGVIGSTETLIMMLSGQPANKRCEFDYGVRAKAADALGRLKAGVAVNPLIAILRDEHSRMRGEAARTLGKIGDLHAVEPLMAALKDADEEVSYQSVAALGHLKDPRPVEVLISMLGNQPTMAAGDLGAQLRKENLIEALGEIGDPRAFDEISKILNDKRPEFRKEAATALGKIKDARAVEPLILMLKTDENSSVRREAAAALGHIPDHRAVESLIATLIEEKPKLRKDPNAPSSFYSCTIALSKMKAPESIEPLISILEDSVKHFDGSDDIVYPIVDTLVEITGEKGPGRDPVKWRLWWNRNKGRLLGMNPSTPEIPEKTKPPVSPRRKKSRRFVHSPGNTLALRASSS
ncbi:MAG: HEAT repeat domain-containing protein [bacterium]